MGGDCVGVLVPGPDVMNELSHKLRLSALSLRNLLLQVLLSGSVRDREHPGLEHRRHTPLKSHSLSTLVGY